jgi:ABC-type multidrug transport system ATPase subunit
MNAPVLEASKLSKRYGRVQALSDVSFSLAGKTVTAMLGENGAGKTTLIKLILGFLRADSGKIVCSASHVGYVPERPGYFPWLCGRDIIDLTGRAFGRDPSTLAARLESLAARIGFDLGLLDRRVPGYSLGNQKKLAYLQSLMLSPELLIVDEPFSSLDPLAIRSVREILAEGARGGQTVLLSSHMIGELERIAGRFIILKRGAVLVDEDLERLRRDYLFVRFPAGLEAPAAPGVGAVAPWWVRESALGPVMLVEKAEAERAAGGMGILSSGAPERPTLESLYFFFTS